MVLGGRKGVEDLAGGRDRARREGAGKKEEEPIRRHNN